MSGGVRVTGLDELIQTLTDAPAAIREDGMAIVRDETEGAATEIRQAYAVSTGRLQNRVRTVYPASGALVGLVQSQAPHSHLYEFGTRQRRTASGANRGVMPAHEVTPQIAVRHRARMYERLIDMVKRMGFQVTEG